MLEASQYLKDRIDDQIAWYSRKSGTCKRAYRRLRMLSVVIALSIPILTGLIGKGWVSDEALKLSIAIAGAAVALAEAVLGLNKYDELWTGYRAAAEGLKYHRYLFEAGAEPYNRPDAFQLFVQQAESLMASERTAWVQVAATKSGSETHATEAVGQAG